MNLAFVLVLVPIPWGLSLWQDSARFVMFQSVVVKNLEGSGVGGAEKEEEVGGDAAGRREPRGGAGREGGSTVNNRSTGTISHGNDFSLSNKDCFVS